MTLCVKPTHRPGMPRCVREDERSLQPGRRRSKLERLAELMSDGRWRTVGEIRMRVAGADKELERALYMLQAAGRLRLERRVRRDYVNEVSEYRVRGTGGGTG